MFFSTESWKRGGGGRSTAKKRNGDTVVLISVRQTSAIINVHSREQFTAIDIETRLLATLGFWSYENLLRFHSELALEGSEDNTWSSTGSVGTWALDHACN